MIVLGIESSCDESAVAILKLENSIPQIIFEEISSQIKIHALYGGVVPEIAAREHLANLPILIDRALKAAQAQQQAIDLIAVTQGPGLKGCLLIGLELAKGLALGSGIPLIGVNHIEGHIHAAKLNNPELKEPFLSLVVSGGHSEIVLVEELGKYKVLARTIDDAAGEAFDKSAYLLGFEYPGGAALAKLADSIKSTRFELPKVMREAPGFSFSGLKTAISLLLKRNATFSEDPQIKAELAYAIQDSIVDSLYFKLKREIDLASTKNIKLNAITLTGGVACNSRLREKIQNNFTIPVYIPEKKHCVDNAAMIALVGGLNYCLGKRSDYNLEVQPRWPIETLGLTPAVHEDVTPSSFAEAEATEDKPNSFAKATAG